VYFPALQAEYPCAAEAAAVPLFASVDAKKPEGTMLHDVLMEFEEK